MTDPSIQTDTQRMLRAIEHSKLTNEQYRNYFKNQAQETSVDDWRERYDRQSDIHGAIADALGEILSAFTESEAQR